jgi:hypothetical protein
MSASYSHILVFAFTVPAEEWKVLCTCPIIVQQGRDVRPVRVYGSLFREKVLGDLVRRDPDVVVPS